MKRPLILATFVVAMTACEGDSDPVQVPVVDVRGEYSLAALTFDPQGSLPAIEMRSRIGAITPRLVLASGGRAQLVVTDSAGLTSVVDGTYVVTRVDSVRFTFDSDRTVYSKVLMSRVMTFHRTTGSTHLTFTGTPPDGVSRARLLQLVPEFRDEQLLDPVPGVLTIQFARLESVAVRSSSASP